MTSSIFRCCERPDETEYRHPCDCPGARMPSGNRGTLKNELAIMRLCGWHETSGNKSTLPKVYTTLTVEHSGSAEGQPSTYSCGDPDNPPYQNINYVDRSWTFSGSQSIQSTFATSTTSNGQGCSKGTPGESSITETQVNRTVGCANPGCPCGEKQVLETTTTYGPANVFSGTSQYNKYLRFGNWYASSTITSSTSAYDFLSYGVGNSGKTMTATISTEDTDEAVIARTTLIELPNSNPYNISAPTPSTLWETRSTGVSFEYQQCEFQMECSGLVPGQIYKAQPIVRKRTAVIGSYGEWEDQTFQPVQFTATDEEQIIPSDDEYITLPQVQGYEFEITDIKCYLA